MNSKCTIRTIAILTISSLAGVVATAGLAQAAGDNTRLAETQGPYLNIPTPPIPQAVKKPALVQVAQANGLIRAAGPGDIVEVLSPKKLADRVKSFGDSGGR